MQRRGPETQVMLAEPPHLASLGEHRSEQQAWRSQPLRPVLVLRVTQAELRRPYQRLVEGCHKGRQHVVADGKRDRLNQWVVLGQIERSQAGAIE